MIQTGLILDKDLDLEFKDGDIKIGDTATQEIEMLFDFNKGAFYQFPDTCFGMKQMQNSNFEVKQLESDLKKELENDNFSIEQLEVILVEDKVTIDVSAERIK